MISPLARAAAPGKGAVVDFEFRSDKGEQPIVWCMAFREIHTGREGRHWRDDLLKMSRPPFDIGPDTATIGYFAQAEWLCFQMLGWPPPAQPIDLFAEVRVAFNRYLPRDLRRPGVPGGDRWGLYDALRRYGLEGGDTPHKTAMRKLAMTATLSSWTSETQRDLLEYNLDDVRKTAQLFDRMFTTIDWPQARLRGLYTVAVAAIEHAGIPIDGPLYRQLLGAWEAIKLRYIAELEAAYKFRFHVGASFNESLLADWVAGQGMEWPFTKAGTIKYDDETLKAMERIYPQIKPFRQFRSHIGELRLIDLAIGSDDRNRCFASTFHAATGRTIYSTTQHVWQVPAYLRGLIRPDADHLVVVFDWKAQENAIAATHSGDQRMIQNYLSHDPYAAFARDSGFVMPDAAGKIDPKLRGQCKRVVLGVPFGMTGYGAAAALEISELRGFDLVDKFKLTYPRCVQWLDEVRSQALSNEIMVSKFGWKWRPEPYCTATRYDPPSRRSILNFPCQANGADMLRGAVVLGWMAGLKIISTMHDAIMLETTKARAEEDIAAMIYCMQEAGRAVTGITLDIDKKVVAGPARYRDETRGADTWDRIVGMLAEVRREG